MRTQMEAATSHVPVEQVACPSCGGNEYTPVAKGPDYDYHCTGDQNFTMVKCLLCQSYYLNPRPTIEALSVIYAPEKYYSYSFSEKGNPVVLRARRFRDKQKIEEALKHLPMDTEKLAALDIGAGDGALLDALRDSGIPASNLFGMDLEPRAVENLRSMGFRGVLGRAEELDLPSGEFDLVTLIQVIEHLQDPKGVMRSVHRILRPGGVVLLETPNIGSWDRRLFGRSTWGGYHFPRHWAMWTPQSLGRLLHEVGFEVVHVSTPPAAVTLAWSLNHVMQSLGLPTSIANFCSLGNPLALGFFWLIDVLPSRMGYSSNIRMIARRVTGKHASAPAG